MDTYKNKSINITPICLYLIITPLYTMYIYIHYMSDTSSSPLPSPLSSSAHRVSSTDSKPFPLQIIYVIVKI